MERDARTVLAARLLPALLVAAVVKEVMRMSRRNSRQGKARRRAERDHRQRPRPADQGPRAVEDRIVQAPRPGGSGPRNSDAHGSGLLSDDGGLTAVSLDEADLTTDTD